MNPVAIHVSLMVGALVATCCLSMLIPGLASIIRIPSAIWTTKAIGLLFFVIPVVLFVPVAEVPILYYVRGVFGDFSVTTLILTCAAMAGRLLDRPLIDSTQHMIILKGIAAMGLLLYPTALGLTRFDLYAWGYFSTPMLVGVGLLGAVALALRFYWIVFILGAALLSAGMGLLPSSNIWDYLMDLPLTIFCLCVVAVMFGRSA